MATYYVDYANGSDGAAGGTSTPWRTMSKAQTAAGAGDTIKLRGSASNNASWYPTAITLNKSLAWEADTGHTPTISGGYNLSGNNYALGGSVPGGLEASMIKVTANDVTLEGIRIQNIGGTAVSCTGHRFTMQNCVVNMTYAAGIIVDNAPGGNTENVLIDGCTFTNTSYAWRDVGGQSGRNAVMLKGCTDLVFSNNYVAYCYKEGINIDKGSVGTVVEYNEIHSINHSAIYINRAADAIVRGNVVYHTRRRDFLGQSFNERSAPAGIKIGDETHKNALAYTQSTRQRIYNNLVIGAGQCLQVSNGTNYDTQLKQAYIGYNTFVGCVWQDASGTSKTSIVVDIADNTRGRKHETTIFENNIIYAPAGVKMVKIIGSSGVLFRNNCWYSADGETAPAGARNSSDVTSNPLLNRPAANFLDVWPAITGTGYALDNYRLDKTSPAIGAASNMAAANGVTPPAITTDLTGATRDDKDRSAGEYFDMGALEHGGGMGGDNVNTVAANFTQSTTSGDAPLIVTFTDTSTEAGTGNIDTRFWDFGDGVTGTDISSPFPYIYSIPGTYTPTLTVYDNTLNKSHTKIGSAITVTAPPIDDTPGTFDVIRTAMPAAAGSKTLLFNLHDAAPALVVMWLTKATAVDAAVDGAMLSYGVATPSSQWAFVFNSRDNQGTSITEKYATKSACILALENGAISGRARVSSVESNRLILDVTTGFPAGYLLTAFAFGGSQYRAVADTFYMGIQNSVTSLQPGFRPELYLFGSSIPQSWDTLEDNADFMLGMSDGVTGLAYSWRDVDALDTMRVKAGILPGPSVIKQGNNTGIGLFSDYAAAQLTVSLADILRHFGYAALDVPTGTEIVVKQFSTPTSTGVANYDCGIEPTGLIGLFTALDNYNHQNTYIYSDGFTLTATDVVSTYGLAIASDHGAATSNTKSMATDNVTVIDGAGTVLLEGAITLTATGFSINWTTVQASPRYFNVAAISATPSIIGPIVDFTADTTRPENGSVQFSDLTNPNGNAITAWAWDFGDGNTSTEQNPAHVYAEPGQYAVTLVVTNAEATASRYKADYIIYELKNEWIGVYYPRSVTNRSTNRLYATDEANAYYGDEEHELDIDALEIDAYPEDMTSVSDKSTKARIVLDKDNAQLIIIWPDGSTNTVAFD